MSTIITAYHTIRNRIAQTCALVGRKTETVQMVVVSKNVAAHQLTPLIEQGHIHFGENYVQEAQEKWHMYPQVSWHGIGHLQTNKLSIALKLFSTLHTLESISLAQALAKARDAGKLLPRLFVQVNIGYEPQKRGVTPDALKPFLNLCKYYALAIDGLMVIPPQGEDPRHHFKNLRIMAHDNGLSQLSMGMSQDFETAIQEGATFIRIGSAIFHTANLR